MKNYFLTVLGVMVFSLIMLILGLGSIRVAIFKGSSQANEFLATALEEAHYLFVNS